MRPNISTIMGDIDGNISEDFDAFFIGIGFEFETSGHVFQVNLTNATALMETDFIPYTTSDWGEGEFRLGFTISRWFNL